MRDPADRGFHLADILRDHQAALNLGRHAWRVARHILGCRTGELGGRLDRCDLCGQTHHHYLSCRDRHCPRCGSLDQALWAEAEKPHLLPGSYFHVVFTVPEQLRGFFRAAPGPAFEALFAAASEALLELAKSQFGARIGVLALLHTWNQLLGFHPHLHTLVTGGGLDAQGRWVHRRRFLLHRDTLIDVFRGKLLQRLRALHEDGVFRWERHSGRALLVSAAMRKWGIEIRTPMAGPEQVVNYFARYTRRIALSDRRIIGYDGQTVTFTYRDRRDGNRVKSKDMPAVDFLRAFFRHVVPPGFVRIRRYGLLANRARTEALRQARLAIGTGMVVPPGRPAETRAEACLRIFGKDPTLCPTCGQGRLRTLVEWGPTRWPTLPQVLATAVGVRGP